MAHPTAAPDRRIGTGTANLDRILLAACGVAWLLALGAAVAATIALIDLAATPTQSEGGTGTPWLLYTVIVVSALVIIAAVPLLLRARRTALDGQAPAGRRRAEDPVQPAGAGRGIETPTGKLRMFGPPAEPVRRPGYVSAAAPARTEPGFPAAAVDQTYVRFGLSVASAMGVATTAIGAATYLMATDRDTLSWVCYGLAGVVTAATVALPWYFLRELGTVLDRRR